MWVHVCLFVVAFHTATADIYLHQPRGSNNRINEPRAQRKNANRAFDSQNNNRGGYNVGDAAAEAHTSEEGQYSLTYFMSGPEGESRMYIEWTNQHGCGGDDATDPGKMNCNVVLQFMCMAGLQQTPFENYPDQLRNGFETDSLAFSKLRRRDIGKETQEEARVRKYNDTNTNRVLHESWESYDRCSIRKRNGGLFLADQEIKANRHSAIYTRQNNNGQRRGYECPEERDYYPYWHPTDWKDIAVFADKQEHCETFQSESFNVKPKGECMVKFPDSEFYNHASLYNNEEECSSNGGEWIEFTNYLELAPDYETQETCEEQSNEKISYGWGIPLRPTELKMLNPGITEFTKQCLVLLKKPDCQEAPRTRVNHLGNTVSGNPIRYTWVIPYFPSGANQTCLLRARYNISTDDYDPINTYSSSNGEASPVQNDPLIDIGVENQPLRLAINTAQFGRTFQDRSHLFVLEKRPDGLESETIHNVGVRGKRGNIVQTFPAVEYDFVPNDLEISEGELVQIQWTGSNTHNNGRPGGDGQTGSDGEGQAGIDRHNVVEIQDRNVNYPMPFEKQKMFTQATVKWQLHDIAMTGKDIAAAYASAGFYRCHSDCGDHAVTSKEERLNNKLDNASPSYRGMLLQFAKGTYHYTSTRNNNFTNRSQKGTITVVSSGGST